MTGPIEHVATNMINAVETIGHALILKKSQPTIEKIWNSVTSIGERVRNYLTHTLRVLPYCSVVSTYLEEIGTLQHLQRNVYFRI